MAVAGHDDCVHTQAAGFRDNHVGSDCLTRGEARLAWQAYDTLELAVVDDYTTWAYKRSLYDTLPLRAVADFPIMIGQRCISVLPVARTEINYPFNDEQLHIGQMLSRLAALVVDNAHQYNAALKEIRERTKTEVRLQPLMQELIEKSQIEYQQRKLAETLVDTTAALNSTLNLDESFRSEAVALAVKNHLVSAVEC